MNILVVLITIGVLATAATLITGIVSMARGGQFDQAHSTQLMLTRVALQGVTLLSLLVVLYLLG
ncbi:MAG: hypothetical protein BMS9Abin10_0484 [Gammaproteobacteria bacterium]|nr:MAG: hypothetical protein BMS9Abin10_0484 [Gammaproteobacteria bacterium]